MSVAPHAGTEPSEVPARGRAVSAKTLGVFAVVGLVVAFSLSSTLVKRAESPGVLVAFWRMVTVSVVWNAVLWSTGRRITMRDIRQVFIPGVFFGLNLALFFAGATHNSVATAAKTSARGSMYSLNSHAPTGTIRNGASDPISAAFATLLCVAPAKNTARFKPKNTPGMNTWRTSRIAIRLPVLHSTAFQITLTVTILQNATRTPGDSARFTSVELNEKATTSPTTASTPTVFALHARRHAVVPDDRVPARGVTLIDGP